MNHHNHHNPHSQAHPPHHYQQHHQQQQQHRSGKYITNRSAGNVGGGGNGHDEEGKVNHVLLLTVINPHYNINCDLVHQICSTHGKVNRIVIFRKNGVQAMVEFDTIESARLAKSALNGCDIYSGCCTLRIEYAKPARLNVHKNDNDSYDYVTPTPSDFNDDGQAGDVNHQLDHHHDAYSRQDDNHHHNSHQHHSTRSSGVNRGDIRRGRSMYASNNHPGNSQPLFGGNPPRGTVMMVYGLPAERLNCDRLFNLFCLYGNVARVKFLRSKQGCAMVQMGDAAALDRCVGSLNRVSMFGADLQLSYSKQPFLHEVSQPFILPDGSPSFRDFINSKNNRFNNPDIASKNRILPPSHVLHFFNAPLGITEDELVHLFEQTAGHEPISIKIFTPKAENSKSLSGLAVFGDQIEATEALILCNHISVPKSDRPHPCILRLCFSPPNYSRPPYAAQHDSHGQQQQPFPS